MVPPCSDRMSRVPPYSRTTEKMSRTGLSPIMPSFPTRSAVISRGHWPDPRSLATTDGVSLMSFPPGTEMFQFPGFAFVPYVFRHKYLQMISASPTPALHSAQLSQIKTRAGPDLLNAPTKGAIWSYRYRRWVSPFGNFRIKACSQLPETYRSVPRPSSPLSAKASTGYS